MKIIGALLCLLAVASTEGRRSNSALSLSTSLERTYQNAKIARKRGEYQAAADLFRSGRLEAMWRQEPEFEARFLWGLGNSHFALRRYQEALEEYLEARDSFARLGEQDSVRALEGNIGSLYSQLGELDVAIQAMKRATNGELALESTASGTRRLVTLGTLLAESGKMTESLQVFGQAIGAASRIDDPELLSNAWDRMGGELLSRKELAAAEEALLEAFRIRKLWRLPSLAGSYGKLGLLRMAQGDRRSAAALLDAAVEESRSSRVRIPEWRFYYARGSLQLSREEIAGAYADFEMAVELARNYRLTAPASDAMRVSLEAMLQPVYAAYAETGSRLYFETGRRNLARETFEALEENRGGSLAQWLGEQSRLRRRMTPAYWDARSALQSAEAAALLDGGASLERMRRLRAEIVEMEARAGGVSFHPPANILERLQRRLDQDTALFSFHLGERQSSLWVVSASDLSLYLLPDRASVTAGVQRFRDAIVNQRGSGERLGRELYETLFGQLAGRYQDKTRWLLSLDEAMFEIPFGALVVGNDYLAEKHSLRIVSGAGRLLEPSRPIRTSGPFAGIGDAIYNTADARWPRGAIAPATFGLPRLPGSGTEIEACGRQWRGGSVLLEGADVTRDNVRRVVQGGASVVHFATHVLQDPRRSNEALISLGLGGDGADELLGGSEIGGWNVAAGLVVLSGCHSGAAAARPGAGLMGMTRAWLMAGAGAVVASAWPVSDEPGGFFRVFYSELQRGESPDPAGALRAAQMDAIRSAGWRSRPDYWAAYFIVGNY